MQRSSDGTLLPIVKKLVQKLLQAHVRLGAAELWRAMWLTGGSSGTTRSALFLCLSAITHGTADRVEATFRLTKATESLPERDCRARQGSRLPCLIPKRLCQVSRPRKAGRVWDYDLAFGG